MFSRLLLIENVPAERRRLYEVIESVTFAALIVHVCLVPLFLWLGIAPLMWFNLGSVALFSTCLALNRKGEHALVFSLGVTEVILHAVIAVLMLGWDSGFHYYLLVLLPMLFLWPYWILRHRIVLSALLFIAFATLYLYTRGTPPGHALPASSLQLLYLFNVFAACAIYITTTRYYQITMISQETRLKRANLKLEILANTDPLTALFNRRSMEALLRAEEERHSLGGPAFSILLADIDHFKMINDRYGHRFGDGVLRAVADLLKRSLRAGDHIARWGGEEFLLLLPDTPVHVAMDVAERMRHALSQIRIDEADVSVQITITLGVAQYRPVDTLEDCICRADSALYRGKESGRNRVIMCETA